MLTHIEVVDYYLENTGFKIEKLAFYKVYSLCSLAAIVWKVYYRYRHKQTDNPAFKKFYDA
jgi:aminoglycoside phosphotransferase (APT) family kinase protein